MTTAFTVVDPTSIPMTRSVTDTGVSLPAPLAENQAFRLFSCGDSRVSARQPEKCWVLGRARGAGERFPFQPCKPAARGALVFGHA